MPSAALVPRAATPKDIPALVALAGRIWRAYYPGIIATEQIEYMLARMYAAETILQEMNAGVVWELADLDSETVGFLSATHEPATARLKLNKLYLRSEFHGRGFGQQMLERVVALAQSCQARQIHLQVNKRNTRALRAYERTGFRIAESVTCAIGGGFVMDDFILTRDVPVLRSTRRRPVS